jgi:hypothetical protein
MPESEESMQLYLKQPCSLVYGSKEGTGNLNYMGGSFYVTGLAPTDKEGNYTGAVLGCNVFQGNPSPRRIINLVSQDAKG